MITYILNIIGIVLDIIGATLIFKYTLTPSLQGHTTSIFLYHDEELLTRTNKEREDTSQYKKRSNAGYILLLVGFFFQLGSNIIGLINQP